MDTPYASQDEISKFRAAADIIEELPADLNGNIVTYLGLCRPHTTGTDEPNWSIMKITESASVSPKLTIFQWADGLCCFNLVWDERLNYSYYFKKF